MSFPVGAIHLIEAFLRHVFLGKCLDHAHARDILGQIAHEVEWAVAGRMPVGRVNRIDGEPISPLQILDEIEEMVAS